MLFRSEARVHRWTGAVSSLPGGWRPPGIDRRHQPDPTGHPFVFVVGDYLYDSTLNGVLDSADISATTSQQKARGYVIDPELVGIGYMLGIESNELPDLGGGRRGFILAALTLMVKNPLGLGKFAASS